MLNGTLALAMILVLLAACGAGTETPEPGPPDLDRAQAVEVAWAALEPNTASHNRANWRVVEARQVEGRSVAEEFEKWAFLGACGGPAPPPNRTIEDGERYWYAAFEPLLARPSGPSPDPKGPPQVPEASIGRAAFLLDEYGQVIARMFRCVLY